MSNNHYHRVTSQFQYNNIIIIIIIIITIKFPHNTPIKFVHVKRRIKSAIYSQHSGRHKGMNWIVVKYSATLICS